VRRYGGGPTFNVRSCDARNLLSSSRRNRSAWFDWKRDSAENGLGLAAGGRLRGLAVAAGGGRGGANIGGGNGCAEGCIGWVAGRGTGGGVGLGTDAAGDNCCPLELPHDGVLVKARLKETMAGAGTGAELKGDELRVITQLLDSVAALTGVMLLRLRLLTLLL